MCPSGAPLVRTVRVALCDPQELECQIAMEQAKGLLMSTGLTSAAAFDMLRKVSQRDDRKLHDVASAIVAESERRAAQP